MKHILKRVLLGLVVLVVAALCVGVIYQQIANWMDSRRFPQQGKSIALGPEFPGVSLNLDCSGSGHPTVILDSGLGVPAIGWYQVQSEVAKFTRVCSYDRAGYGWSTPGPEPRTSAQIVSELHALLQKSAEPGPSVFVAHSFGGYNVRVYTAKYPDEVSGLVLVDTSHEDQMNRMSPGLKKFMTDETNKMQTELKFAQLLIYSGLARLMTGLDELKTLPIERRRELRYLELQPKYLSATGSEMLSFDESAAQVRASGNLGNRPLIVLTAGKIVSEGMPENLKTEMQAFQGMWIHDLQPREAALSTRGKQIVVPDSDHMIPIERPQPIIDAIREVVEEVRASTLPVSIPR